MAPPRIESKLRLPAELHRWAAGRAEAEGLPLNGWLTTLLVRLRREEAAGAAPAALDDGDGAVEVPATMGPREAAARGLAYSPDAVAAAAPAARDLEGSAGDSMERAADAVRDLIARNPTEEESPPLDPWSPAGQAVANAVAARDVGLPGPRADAEGEGAAHDPGRGGPPPLPPGRPAAKPRGARAAEPAPRPVNEGKGASESSARGGRAPDPSSEPAKSAQAPRVSYRCKQKGCDYVSVRERACFRHPAAGLKKVTG